MDRFGWIMLRGGVAVGVAVSLTVRVIQLVVERLRGQHFSRTVGWRAMSAWGLGFAIATFAVAAAMSIGLLLLPFAVIVCGVAAWRCRALPEGAIGAGVGTGLVLFVIGVMNPTPTPCAIAINGGDPRACGIDGTSWLPLAVALVVVAGAGQILSERGNGRVHARRDPSHT